MTRPVPSIAASLLPLLLLLLVSLATPPTQATCINPPPGVAKMIRGVDITSLDLVPLGIVSTRGIKGPVINFTCHGDRKWTSPSGKVYQLPDQMWHITSTPGGWMSANVNLFKTSDDVRTWMNSNVGGNGSIFKFSFSGSYSYKKMQNAITNSSRYVEDVSAFESATRAEFVPDFFLTMGFFADLYVSQFITGTFESDRDAYQNFINIFGTHYFSNANFGGFIRAYMRTNKDYVLSKSEQEIKADAKASFLEIVSAHGGIVSGSKRVSENFRQATSRDTKYYGGNVNLLLAKGIEQWQPTVRSDPWLFSGELKPISSLISDKTKQANMVKAVKEHVMRRYLDELSRLVDAARKKLTGPARPVLNTLDGRIDAMKRKKILVEAEVEALANDIRYQLIVPSWFTGNTKLCYKWWPDGDGGQCGGGAARLLCAAPNSRTPVYRDDTDSRSGGCRMQWGLQSTNYDSWFSRVRVCYRWYPDGDGGQCGDGAARLLCSSVNSFTPVYRDDTDRRRGGCRMSWKLELPAVAPLWLKTASLCYYWYPDGDGGQCGGGASRTLCASNNGWTPYYRDDTDRRSGGCRMSWGLNVGL